MIQIPPHARTVTDRLTALGYEAYVVGGCVRDSLMGREPKDWDVCTDATPQQVLAAFKRFHVIKTGLQHGTVTVMLSHLPVEVTTYRIDGDYQDNRHPESVAFVSRLEDDLARRDFTINAMAYNPERGLVDAFGGQQDLADRLIRCVGEPEARFREDGLRILRALRFASRFRFDIERSTSEAIRSCRHLLANISAERIFTELKGILAGEGVLNMLLAYPEVFCTIIPELAPSVGFAQNNPHHCYDVWTHTAHAVQAAPRDATIRLALLLHDIAKPGCYSYDPVKHKGHFYGHPEVGAGMAGRILRRLKSDNETHHTVCTLVREHDSAWPTTPAGMRRLIGRLGLDIVQMLFSVKSADQAAQSGHEREQKKAAMRNAALLLDEVLSAPKAFSVKDLAINGNDLMSMGVPAGPSIGRMLAALLAEVQDDVLENAPHTLFARAADLMHRKG